MGAFKRLYSDNLVNLTSFLATMYSKKKNENLMYIRSYIAKISCHFKLSQEGMDKI